MKIPSQNWNVENYQKYADFVPKLGKPVIELLNPQKGEVVLDLGCGDGYLIEELVAAGCTVIGVDNSLEMVAAAKSKGLHVVHMDAKNLTFHEEFDAVFSNAVLHWIQPPEEVLQGVYKSLKPDGRFVGELGGEGNIHVIESALIGGLNKYGFDGNALTPWHFPSKHEYKMLLEKCGFTVKHIELIPRMTPLPQGIMGWLETFANPFFDSISEALRATITQQAIQLMKAKICHNDGVWYADYVRLRFKATRSK